MIMEDFKHRKFEDALDRILSYHLGDAYRRADIGNALFRYVEVHSAAISARHKLRVFDDPSVREEYDSRKKERKAAAIQFLEFVAEGCPNPEYVDAVREVISFFGDNPLKITDSFVEHLFYTRQRATVKKEQL